jgi:hypothetical protein
MIPRRLRVDHLRIRTIGGKGGGGGEWGGERRSFPREVSNIRRIHVQLCSGCGVGIGSSGVICWTASIKLRLLSVKRLFSKYFVLVWKK